MISLTEDIQNTCCHVYFDNFAGVDLLLTLYRAGLYGCGTMRMNRKGSPTQLQTSAKKSLPARGESQIRQRGNLTVSIWQDNRPVVVIATNSDPTVMDSVKHKAEIAHAPPIHVQPRYGSTTNAWEELIITISSVATIGFFQGVKSIFSVPS